MVDDHVFPFTVEGVVYLDNMLEIEFTRTAEITSHVQPLIKPALFFLNCSFPQPFKLIYRHKTAIKCPCRPIFSELTAHTTQP